MLRSLARKTLRTAQVYSSPELKYKVQLRWRNLVRRPFEADFEVLRYFRPPQGSIVVDVGANRGQSIFATRLYHRDIPLVAFEPNGETMRKLEWYTRNVSNVRLIQSALGVEQGVLQLFTPIYRGYVFDGLASTVRSAAEDWLNPRRVFFYDRRRLEIREETVPVQSLDSFQFRPAFLKIDVQGAEELVLRGALETISSHKPIILAEQSPQSRFRELLRPLGYEAYRYDHGVLKRQSELGANVLLVPPERKEDLSLPIVE